MDAMREKLWKHDDEIAVSRNNSAEIILLVMAFSFVSKQGVSSENGSSLASLRRFNRLGLCPGKSGRERYIKSSILKAFYPLKAPSRKLVPFSMEKECAFVRRVRPCLSDIIVAKKKVARYVGISGIEIRRKHVFLIVVLVCNRSLREDSFRATFSTPREIF